MPSGVSFLFLFRWYTSGLYIDIYKIDIIQKQAFNTDKNKDKRPRYCINLLISCQYLRKY